MNEEKCRKYTKIIFYYVFCNQAAYVSNLIPPFFSLLHGNYETSGWGLMYDLVLPFDKTKIWGWFMTWFTQFNVGFSYSLVLVSITSYFVCCCFYMAAICDHFDYLMETIKKDMECCEGQSNAIGNAQNRLKIKKQLSDAIDLHVSIFE